MSTTATEQPGALLAGTEVVDRAVLPGRRDELDEEGLLARWVQAVTRRWQSQDIAPRDPVDLFAALLHALVAARLRGVPTGEIITSHPSQVADRIADDQPILWTAARTEAGAAQHRVSGRGGRWHRRRRARSAAVDPRAGRALSSTRVRDGRQ